MSEDPFAVQGTVPAREIITPATVRWRIKGNADGPVYSGQHIIKGCRTCGKPVDHLKLTTSADSPGFSVIEES